MIDNKLKIGIVGSRTRNTDKDRKILHNFLKEKDWLDPDKVIYVSGGCPKGGDKFAEELSAFFHIEIIIFRAEWRKYGKCAGFIRNEYIAEECDILVAIENIDRPGGTENTIGHAERLGKKVYIL